MIGHHCGVRTVPFRDTATYFVWRCTVCRQKFRQRKRRRKAYSKPPDGLTGAVVVVSCQDR